MFGRKNLMIINDSKSNILDLIIIAEDSNNEATPQGLVYLAKEARKFSDSFKDGKSVLIHGAPGFWFEDKEKEELGPTIKDFEIRIFILNEFKGIKAAINALNLGKVSNGEVILYSHEEKKVIKRSIDVRDFEDFCDFSKEPISKLKK